MKYLIYRYIIFVLKFLFFKFFFIEFKLFIVFIIEKLNLFFGSCEWVFVFWLFCSRFLIFVSKKMVFFWNFVLKKNLLIFFWFYLFVEVINNNYNIKYDNYFVMKYNYLLIFLWIKNIFYELFIFFCKWKNC